jgi:hypothetical protein
MRGHSRAACPARARRARARRCRAPFAPRRRRERDHARADRGREEGRQGRLLHLDRPAGAERSPSASRRNSRHRGAGRAHRRRARVPAHRPGIHSRIYAVDVVNSSDAAHFIVWKRDGCSRPIVPEDVAKHFPPSTRTRTACSRASASAVLDRLQHQPGEGRGRAEELRRSARSEMVGKIVKAHPGYSGTILTATYPDRARSRLGAISRSSPSRRSCRCSRRPIRRRSSRSASAR